MKKNERTRHVKSVRWLKDAKLEDLEVHELVVWAGKVNTKNGTTNTVLKETTKVHEQQHNVTNFELGAGV